MPKTGYITPSSYKALCGGKKDEFSETALAYGDLVVMDMFFGVKPPELNTASIKWGNETEWEAVKAYEEAELVVIEHPGFTVHPTIHFAGGTPDGIIADSDGGIDTKCPNSANHLRNIFCGEQMELYEWQFQGYMWIFNRDWWVMASYDPRYPEYARLSVTRVQRDEKKIALIEQRVRRFWWEVIQVKMSELQKKFPDQKPFFNH